MLIYNTTANKHYWRGKEIAKEEYNSIKAIILNKPTAPDGYDYVLSDAMEWVLVSAPPAEKPVDPVETRLSSLEGRMDDVEAVTADMIGGAL